MSYPTPKEVREALRATAPGTVLWEGRLEQTDDELAGDFVPPLRAVVVGPQGRLVVRVLWGDEDDGGEWHSYPLRFNRGVSQFALSRHGLCAPPVGWEEVVL